MRSLLLGPLLMIPAACSGTPVPDDQPATASGDTGFPFETEVLATYDEPWAADFMPGTDVLFVTGKKGEINWIDVSDGRTGRVTQGIPEIAYGGQGGLGDIAFSPTAAVENPPLKNAATPEAASRTPKRLFCHATHSPTSAPPMARIGQNGAINAHAPAAAA